MFSQEKMIKLKRLFQDPEWGIIEEMFLSYIEPLKDISNINLEDSSKVVKGEIRAKLDFYNAIQRFLIDAKQIADGRISEDTVIDSME